MFWGIVLSLSLPGPKGEPITAPVMVPPAVAFIAEPQCEAAIKAIATKTGSKSLACAQVTVVAKHAESF